ncbi:MAG: hypothetical protein KIT31_17885 [Deltaproteobacteria bacterium]|nr:hypothetical protein [Deltaproteobacteria bacterium]
MALAALIVLAGGAAAAYLWLRGGPPDPRLAQAFTLAQRGEHERAGQVLEDYLGTHPGDPDALALRAMTKWWDGSSVDEVLRRATDAPLSPVQRAMIRAIELSVQRRESEAAAMLESLPADVARAPELIYMRGEMLWHSQRIVEGAATLEAAFAADPRWQVALHHVIEYRLSRGEPASLVPLAAQLRTVDAAAADAVACRIALAERSYDEAARIARTAREREPIPELDICLAQALTLAGDLDAARTVAKRALDQWPIDTREWGGFAAYAEQFLYRGQLDEYLAFVRQKPSRQRTLALALWRPTPDLSEPSPSAAPRTPPPLGAALWILLGWQRREESAMYETYPEPEVRLYGRALWGESREGSDDAVGNYREALGVPAGGDIDMLVSHHLARALLARRDPDGAARACAGVLAPRVYHTYRAILLPDCMLWSNDRGNWQRLVDAWQGASFEHPAVAEARRRLAAPQ